MASALRPRHRRRRRQCGRCWPRRSLSSWRTCRSRCRCTMTSLVLSQSKSGKHCNEVAQKQFLLLLQHDVADRAAGLGGCDRAHRHQHRRMQKTARTPWSSSSRAGWSSAGQPSLPEMLAVENAALHEFFESGLRTWRPSSPRSAASEGARQAQRRAHHDRRDATEVGAWHWPSAAKVLPICTHTCTLLPCPERLYACTHAHR